MRGVAALFVVYRHYSEMFGPIRTQFSYLAVDLFFLLSGFVLALRYDVAGAARMPSREPLIRRAIRLYPLYLLGIVLSLGLLDFDEMLPSDFRIAVVTGLMMLPSPTAGSSPSIVPLMQSGWSLFFELFVANTLFAIMRGRLSTRWLLAIVACAGLALLTADAILGSLDIGSTWPTFVGGFPRTLFPFFTGMALQRLHENATRRRSIPSWVIVLILVLLLLPSIPGPVGRFYEIACVFAAFPALVHFGSSAFKKRPAIGRALGDMSYALYAIHVPLVLFFGTLARRQAWQPGIPLTIVLISLLAALALLVVRVYDEPLRAWINRRRHDAAIHS
ncbi:acyltransferase [Sphingomonas sp. BIUV-7]|uniref:Acyltransferase n=1 Tax=Sphingomonas natans TaxID=3063330 RepID=A0ABT8Y978_9SPHN|nr:acyltransferase [Sphingomonas sp. BIUV-7]MDO6414879.1 acyltransferase [Sphingomonas sp. BIUV-7]